MAHAAIVVARGLACVAIAALAAGCAFLGSGPGDAVDTRGFLEAGWAAENASCVPFADEDHTPRTFDFVSLPGGLSWDREKGILDASGKVLLADREWARVVGRVANERRMTCPGIPLLVERIEPIPRPTDR